MTQLTNTNATFVYSAAVDQIYWATNFLWAQILFSAVPMQDSALRPQNDVSSPLYQKDFSSLIPSQAKQEFPSGQAVLDINNPYVRAALQELMGDAGKQKSSISCGNSDFFLSKELKLVSLSRTVSYHLQAHSKHLGNVISRSDSHEGVNHVISGPCPLKTNVQIHILRRTTYTG